MTQPEKPPAPSSPENPQTPVMIAIGGLSGSGKTTLAYVLSRHLPNTVVLDADVVRKRMLGHNPLTPLPDALYTRSLTERFIAYTRAEAAHLMAQGKNVIATGLFIDSTSRTGQRTAAENAGGRFIGLYLDMPPAKLFQRVASRTENPSDARIDTLRRQLKSRPSQPGSAEGWHILRADKSIEHTLQAALRHVKAKGISAAPAPQHWKPF